MFRSPIVRRCAALIWVLSLVASTAQAAEEEDDPYYEGFYQTSVVYLETANLSIGILGDANTKGVYDKQMATKIAAVHAVVAQDMAKSWNKMAKQKGIEEADAESMQRMAKACTLIQKQADALIAIAAGEDQAAEYQKQREAAAKAIAAVRKEMDDFFKK